MEEIFGGGNQEKEQNECRDAGIKSRHGNVDQESQDGSQQTIPDGGRDITEPGKNKQVSDNVV